MIYAKILFDDDQFCCFGALRANWGDKEEHVTFTLPPAEGPFDAVSRYDILSVYLMTETGKTLHKICGWTREPAEAGVNTFVRDAAPDGTIAVPK